MMVPQAQQAALPGNEWLGAMPLCLTWAACCRYDVLLQANQPRGNYWINALAVNATRVGSPGGYGVLRYAGANATLPSDPILQPESIPAWSFGTVSAVGMPSISVFLVSSATSYSPYTATARMLTVDECLAGFWESQPWSKSQR